MTERAEGVKGSEPVDFAAVLAARIVAVQRQGDSLREAITRLREARSLTFADDEHDPDGSTTSLDQARDAALLQRTEQTLTELREARDRLREGRFGRCERCAEPIAEARLEARPEARYCVGCSKELRAWAGVRRRRP